MVEVKNEIKGDTAPRARYNPYGDDDDIIAIPLADDTQIHDDSANLPPQPSPPASPPLQCRNVNNNNAAVPKVKCPAGLSKCIVCERGIPPAMLTEKTTSVYVYIVRNAFYAGVTNKCRFGLCWLALYALSLNGLATRTIYFNSSGGVAAFIEKHFPDWSVQKQSMFQDYSTVADILTTH
jgi:hypothetical protein